MAERYRKKQVEVEAVQWTGGNIEEIHAFMSPHKPTYMSGFKNADDLLSLPGGVASKGDWILRSRDHFEPVDPETFEATYEPANQDRPQPHPASLTEEDQELIEAAVEFYGEALGLIRDLLKDAERIYEPGFEDPPHIAGARNLADHEGTIRDLRKLAAKGSAR